MSEAPDQQVRKILVLPTDSTPRVHDTVAEQLKCFITGLEARLQNYREAIEHNSAAVFAVNYVQNYFVCSQFSVELARLWEMMNIKTESEFEKALEAIKAESEESATLVQQLEQFIAEYDDLMRNVDKELDEKLGPCPEIDEDISERGVPNQTISHYCKGSAFELVLIIIVRSFSTPEINQHILSLYNKMADLRKMGCDVSLLTKGPPIGGGSYIKLIGVPFRRLYDDNDALNEMKANRKSVMKVASWKALTKMMEDSLNEDGRPKTADKENNDDETAYVIQMGGTILVNRSGEILYKYVEDSKNTWPTVETLITEVKKHTSSATKSKTSSGNNKVESEISATAAEKTQEKEDKKCCTIL